MLAPVRGLRRRLGESGQAFGRAFANPGLRRLQLAWAGSVTGGWAYSVALAVFAYDAGGAAAVGIVGVIRYVPSAIASPFVAVLADRYPRRHVMIASDLARAAALVAAAGAAWSGTSPWVVYALAAVVAITGASFRPAQAALLPKLAREPEELTAANVTSTTIESVGVFVGPALGGLLLAATDAGVVFAVTAAAFVWSALLVVGIGAAEDGRRVRADGGEPFLDELLAGFRVIGRSRGIRVLTLLTVAQTAVFGAFTVLTVVLAFDVLDTGASGVGFLNAAVGVGGVVGTVAAFALVGRSRLAFAFAVGNVLWGLPLVAAGLLPDAFLALALFAVIGVANTVADVAGLTLIQRVVPDDVLGRVFGALEAMIVASIGLGALATPALVHALGAEGATIAVGALLPVLVLLLWRPLAAIDARAEPPPALALLQACPLFAPLPAQTLEQLARALVRVPAAGGAVILRAGEAGDRFYLIESGSVSVSPTPAGARVLGPGESFGEIALLRDVPRTATVTATADTTLLALERDDFLAAVTGDAAAAEAAEGVAAARLGTA
jgi:predicted MFS family arabinose efflux permease